jgi:diguanylate cyclase (GGDEF)-like protein
VTTSVVQPRPADVLLRAAADLKASPTGIDFIYRSLDRVNARLGGDDAILVLEEPLVGRQAFRLDRRPIDNEWAATTIRTGEVGLHTHPHPTEPELASGLLNMCSLAVRLDVAQHDALHDPLTGLLNRRAFDDLLEASCAQARRYGWGFALVLIDLDHFKVVNDRFGHSVGDITLRAVGSELRARLRAGDAAARLGGDEFALVLPTLSLDTIPKLMARLHHAVEVDVPAANLTFSAGVATSPDDGLDAAALLRVADQRLYERKAGRSA